MRNKKANYNFKDFTEQPVLTVTGFGGASGFNLNIKIPLFITKFGDVAAMDQATFFDRWRKLNKPEQESSSTFTATKPIVKENGKLQLVFWDGIIFPFFSCEFIKIVWSISFGRY